MNLEKTILANTPKTEDYIGEMKANEVDFDLDPEFVADYEKIKVKEEILQELDSFELSTIRIRKWSVIGVARNKDGEIVLQTAKRPNELMALQLLTKKMKRYIKQRKRGLV